MEGIQPLVNVITLVFIVSTMLAAGLATTLGMLAATFRHLTLVGLVLVANFVLVPLAGWGVAAAFRSSSPPRADTSAVTTWHRPAATSASPDATGHDGALAKARAPGRGAGQRTGLRPATDSARMTSTSSAMISSDQTG